MYRSYFSNYRWGMPGLIYPLRINMLPPLVATDTSSDTLSQGESMISLPSISPLSPVAAVAPSFLTREAKISDSIFEVPRPTAIALSKDGLVAFVTSSNNIVSIVDLNTHTVVGVIDQARGFNINNPTGIALSPIYSEGTIIYVVNNGDREVLIINTNKHELLGVIDTRFKRPYGIAIHPDGSTAFLTNSKKNTVSVIDLATNNIFVHIRGFNQPKRIAFSPIGPNIYITNFGDNTVSVVRLNESKHFVKHGVIGGFNGPIGIAINPLRPIAYVTNANDNTVSIVDLKAKKVVGNILGFNTPLDITISPDGLTAYVTNRDSSTISVVSLRP